MEQFSRNYPPARQDSLSSRSSIYSTDSAGRRTSYVEDQATIDTPRTTSSRTASYTPSYMSAAVPRRKPTPISTSSLTAASASSPTVAASAPAQTLKPVTPRAAKGLLLLVIAAHPPKTALSHIHSLLRRHSVSGITIVGHNDHEGPLKQLRIDTYGLIGRLNMELGVQTYLRGGWSAGEIESVLADAVGKVGEQIRAVLCIPGADDGPAPDDILGFDEARLAAAWQQSFGFVHAVARTAFPLFVRDGAADRTTSAFFVTQTISQGAATPVMRSACGMLLRQLANSHSADGLAVGYAEDNLLPEPEPAPEPEPEIADAGRDAPSNYSLASKRNTQPTPAGGESPTKLWGMWALQEQLGDA